MALGMIPLPIMGDLCCAATAAVGMWAILFGTVLWLGYKGVKIPRRD